MRPSAFNVGDNVFGVKILGAKPGGHKGIDYTYECVCGRTGTGTSRHIKTRKCKGCTGYSKANCYCRVFSTYKKNAKKRSLCFMLNYKDFLSLINSECFYCGSGLSNTSKKHKSFVMYNGIDRIDNEQGYILDNCVTACKTCNFAKASMSQNQFLEWVKSVYEHSLKNRIAT